MEDFIDKFGNTESPLNWDTGKSGQPLNWDNSPRNKIFSIEANTKSDNRDKLKNWVQNWCS